MNYQSRVRLGFVENAIINHIPPKFVLHIKLPLRILLRNLYGPMPGVDLITIKIKFFPLFEFMQVCKTSNYSKYLKKTYSLTCALSEGS